MKTFDDLKFKPHPIGNGVQALMFFPNGYGVSVVRNAYSYTSDDKEWELAVLVGNKNSWRVDSSTEITDNVIGHLKDIEVTEVMRRVQQL